MIKLTDEELVDLKDPKFAGPKINQMAEELLKLRHIVKTFVAALEDMGL